MKEKRAEKRLQLARYLKVFDRTSGMFVGHMVDVHLRGMLMVSERPILPGSELKFGLEIFAEKMPLTLEAIWCEEDTGLESYNIGCRIVDLPPDTETCIRALMEALESRS
ncbi:MAG: PilZ domain-containing protein [Desulfococcaceae bacterium]